MHRRLGAALAAAAARATRPASSSAPPPALAGVALLERLPVVVPPPPAWRAAAVANAASRAAAARRELPKELAPDDGAAGAGGARGWAPAPVETEADAAGDRTSLRRALTRRLFMVVRDGESVSLPSSPHSGGDEPIRAAAERALAAATSNAGAYEAYFVGNAPAGHAGGGDGGTMFFHRAQLIAGAPAPAAPGARLEWLTKEELVEALGGGGELGRVLEVML